VTHLSRHPDDYQPSNITFSHLAPYPPTLGPNGKWVRLAKRAKYEAMAERALADLSAWAGLAPGPNGNASPEGGAGDVVAASL
jgi:methylenetetrahydrofolate--tRNA-(uracil-5-)-methyltransferase